MFELSPEQWAHQMMFLIVSAIAAQQLLPDTVQTLVFLFLSFSNARLWEEEFSFQRRWDSSSPPGVRSNPRLQEIK